jgi:iron-sulfur cluster assembly protein
MITLTPQAAEQVRIAARQAGTEGMALRIAGRTNPDGTIAYGMGFDEAHDDDVRFTSEGVDVIVAVEHSRVLKGTVLDYVELEPGDFRFIFMNSNDANYAPPAPEGSTGNGPAGDGPTPGGPDGCVGGACG